MKFCITFLVFVFLLSASGCSGEQTAEISSSDQTSVLIESKTPELTSKVETSSKANVTSSKPAVTSRETTTTSKTKPETSFEKVNTSSKNVYTSESLVVETKPIIPFSSKPNSGTYRFTHAEEICDAPELKAEIDALNETFRPNGLEISLEGEGDKISYVYRFLTQMENPEELKVSLEQALMAQKATFNAQVELLQAEVENKLVLGIKYVNADGTVICEAEYPQ